MPSLRVDGTAIARAESTSVVAILAKSRSPDVVGAIVNDAHTHADWLIEGAKSFIPPGPIACTRGCSFCCHLRVVTTIPEVLWIATTFQLRNDPAGVLSLRERVDAYVAAVKGLDGAGRRLCRLACPLLENGLCLAYEVRPLSCRGWNSLDVSGCETHLRDPSQGIRVPVYEAQYQIGAFVQLGLTRGLQSAGLQHDRVELPDALAVALSLNDAASRWLGGEKVFEPAAECPPEVPLSNPSSGSKRSELGKR
jgi:hypothetical protein